MQARNANLTFIKLDGNVGCVVNGAGGIGPTVLPASTAVTRPTDDTVADVLNIGSLSDKEGH